MPRHLLSAALLSVLALACAGPAMAMEPARHSADGGCPSETQSADPAGAAGAAAASPVPAPAPALPVPPQSSQPPQRRTLSSGEATRVPLRWHSFVPGMFM